MSTSLGVLWNGRRHVVKVTPTTPLQQVLEDASNFYKVDAKLFALKRGKAKIDLSLPFRFSNIPGNSNLELVENERPISATKIGGAPGNRNSEVAKCRIALVVEGRDGTVVKSLPTSVFLVTTTLYNIIQHSITEWCRIDSLTHSPELDGAEISHMQTRYGGTQLETNSLASMGLSGQAVRLRLHLPHYSSDTAAGGKGSSTGGKEMGTSPRDKKAEDKGMDVCSSSSVFEEQGWARASARDAVAVVPGDATAAAAELRNLLSEHFDAVCKPVVVTLCKYMFNIWEAPLEPKFRVIFTDNRTFQDKIAPAQAALRFLAAVGFVKEIINNRPALKLGIPEGAREDDIIKTLKPIMNSLCDALDELNIHGRERPILPDRQRSAERNSQKLEQQQKARESFDPFKTYVRRVADVNPDGSVSMIDSFSGRSPSSSTDEKLLRLQNRRLELEGNVAEADSEQTRVVFPNDNYTHKSPQDVSHASDESEMYDSKLLAEAMATTLKNKPEDAPLTTAAIRAVRKAENELVYSRTLLRVRFPDRVAIERYFHPRSVMKDVYRWVRSCLQPQVALESGDKVELYISPPKQALKEDEKTLIELQLVPAALVNVKWDSTTVTERLGSYLHTDLSGNIGQSLKIPVGVPLVPSTATTRSMTTPSESLRSTDGTSSGSAKSTGGTSAKKTGKPAWFKL